MQQTPSDPRNPIFRPELVGLDKNSRRGSLLIGVAARLARWVMLTLGRTWRIEVVAGGKHLDALIAEHVPPEGSKRNNPAVLLSFWHNRVFMFSYFGYQRLHQRGIDVTLLASHSRDGELVTRVCKRWGLNTVRGSASRGGTAALRGLHRAITRRGSSPIMIPDGPRGPLYHFKVGVAVLAQTTRAPILPLGFAASRFFTLKSWDRIVVPLPFSRVAVTIGEPQFVERGLSSDELEAERQRLERLIDDLTREAEEAVGVVDAVRPTAVC